jgi:8-oxo-dGTP diphosphatase
MIRRVGEAVRPGMRYRQRTGVYAILHRDNRLLLTHQDAPKPEFQLPGGGVDPGESPVLALHREVFEETGWRIGRATRIGAFRRFTYMPEYDLWAEKLCHVYVARPVLPHGPPSEPGHTAHWMRVDLAVESLGNEGDRMFVSRLFG